jgi:hypothetical protein
VKILAARMFDHKPMFITYSKKEGEYMHVNCGAKFQAKWLLDDGANKIIKKAWCDDTTGGSSIQVMQQKLETCKVDLRR